MGVVSSNDQMKFSEIYALYCDSFNMKNNKYELYRDVMKKRNLQLEKWCGVPENPVFLYLQIMIQTMSHYRPNDYQTSKLI